MTYEQREQIFSKEAINLDDMMALLGVCRSEASIKIKQMKRQLGKDRLGTQGKIHVQDYIAWLKLEKDTYLDRYRKPIETDVLSGQPLSQMRPRIIEL